MAHSDSTTGTVLVLAPKGRDGAMVCAVLEKAGVKATCCNDIESLLQQVLPANAAIVAEEALVGAAIGMLTAALAKQPRWSDFPLIVLGAPNSSSGAALFEQLSPVANLTLIERPARPFTLITVTRAALRARARQRLTRDYLSELMLAREEIARQVTQIERQMLVFDTALSGITDGAYIFDRAGRFVYANKAMLDLWRLSLEEVVGRNFFDLGYPSEQATKLQGQIEHVFSTGEYVRDESPYTGPTGIQGHYEYIFVPVRLPSGRIEAVAGSTRDITARKLLETERAAILQSERLARSEAERVGYMKDEFLATLSHELRTPLNAIAGWTHLLRRGTLSASDQEKAIDTIARNTQAQKELIEDLLDMSRIVSGKTRLNVQPIDLPLLISEAVESLRPAAEAKGVSMLKAMAPQISNITGDPARLQQVLWNLINNAVKFTPPGGRVEITLTRVDPHVQISVGDTGIGIPADFLPYVFDRFRQADASSTRRHGGLGLGLSIVKQLVEMHGGRVSVSSAGDGRGSTFTVSLPLGSPDSTEVAADRVDGEPRGTGQDESSNLTGVTVLVVDDDHDGRVIVQRMLEESHARVLTADSVQAATRILAESNVDVLLSDIGMPERDGYDLIRQVRYSERPQLRDLPAAALTAFARSEDRVRALSAGYDLHISKPVEPAELLSVVSRLRHKRARASQG